MREGQVAPDFTVLDQEGKHVQLKELRGKPVVLYFYPRASTSGCTIESREFRDTYAKFQKRGVLVMGISPDTVKAQKKFQENESLPFQLLADDTREIAERYGLVKEKNMYGRKVTGVARTTLLIAPDGKIAHVFTNVKPEGHAEEVLEKLDELGWKK